MKTPEMELPFFGSAVKKRDQLVVVDLGSRTTKAVHIERKGETLTLANFTLQDAPIYDRTMSVDLLTDHLKTMMQSLGARAKYASFVLGPADSLLRHAEMPIVPVEDMRQMLKFGAKNYLQQDLPDHLFDCQVISLPEGATKGESTRSLKAKVLVGGGKRQLVEDVQTAAHQAGLHADQITTSLLGPANAFEMAMPELFSKEVIALVDFGYKNSTISILMMGELVLNRVVGFGAAKLTSGIAESLGITTAEAEGIKVGMPQEVESTLQPLLTPLGRELRASIDFFEHQQDKTVSQVFFSGGSARSEYIVQALQSELMVPCKSWNPTTFLTLGLPPQQMAELEQTAPQLTVAVGAAVAAF